MRGLAGFVWPSRCRMTRVEGTVTRRRGWSLVAGLAAVFVLSSFLAVPSSAISHDATVSGTVQLDGGSLAGVGVFLGINPPSTNPGFEGRFMCTDMNGDFSFANVPLATPLVAVTGPGGCDNPLYVDPEATPLRPLATTTFIAFGDTIADDINVVVSVPRVPAVGVIATRALEMVEFCLQEGKPQAAQNSLDAYTQEIAAQDAGGYLTAGEVDVLTSHGASLQFTIDAGACLGFDVVNLVEPNGRWHLRRPDGSMYSFFYGNPGDVALFGDWDGDGFDTPGMYRPTNGFAYLTNDLPPEGGVGVGDPALTFFFGGPGDQVFVGDWDGNGTDTLGISRNGKMFLANTNATVFADMEFWFGTSTDIAFGGDPDGDGSDSVFLYRPSSGFTYFTNSTPVGPNDVAPTDGTLFFGVPTDRFVIGDWNGDGTDTVGVFRPGDTTVYLRNTNTTGPAGVSYPFGQSQWLPIAGIWS